MDKIVSEELQAELEGMRHTVAKYLHVRVRDVQMRIDEDTLVYARVHGKRYDFDWYNA